MNKKALLGLAAWTFSQVVAAQTYGFDCITDINAANCAAGTSQLQVTVSGTSVSQALFTFTNVGTAALSLADVYFDDGTLLAIATIANGAGVSFSQGASPSNLPGGTAIGFNVTAGFSADADPPVQRNGVNPGE